MKNILLYLFLVFNAITVGAQETVFGGIVFNFEDIIESAFDYKDKGPCYVYNKIDPYFDKLPPEGSMEAYADLIRK